jgi:cyclic-di-AMP phosphodiesterase PgpH
MRIVARSALRRPVVAVLFSLVVGLLLSPGLTRSIPRYSVGEFTTASVRAPYDFTVVDEAATTRRREQAASETPPVAVLDGGLAGRVKARVAAAFGAVGRIYAEAGSMREVAAPELKGLSVRQQAVLRQKRSRDADGFLSERLSPAVAEFERALGVPLTEHERSVLIKRRFDPRLAEEAGVLLDDAYAQPVILDLAPLERAVAGDPATKNGPGRLAIRNAGAGTERLVGMPLPIRQRWAAVASLSQRADVLLLDADPVTRALLVRLAAAQIQPNLAFDKTTTEARRAAAAKAALPISLTFRRNQLIIGEGREVTEQTVVALDFLRSQGMPTAYLSRLFGSSGLVLVLLAVVFWVTGRVARRGPLSPSDSLYVAATLTAAVLVFWLWRTAVDGLLARDARIPEMALVLMFPFASIAMLTRFVRDFEIALAQLLVASILLGMFSEFGVPLAAYALIAGLAGAHWIAGCTRRSCILGAGLRVGIVSGLAAVCLLLLAGNGATPGSVLMAIAGAVVGGLLAGPVVVALSPVAEWLFGYTTNITLLEMVSYDHPLLKRIMMETPGTFQHSLSISILVDAATKAVGANALLARVGALYHDAGKINNPAFFVENQTGLSAHGPLAPTESARLIRGHVTDGVALVHEYRLDPRLADFVLEHHGTSTIKYFLAEARARGELVNEDDFSYGGPAPRSPETGILMIADQVEATGRTMPGSTEQEFREMVHRTIERIRVEGQLDQCPLTLRDLSVIEQAMVQVLVGMHHHRITYPTQSRTA